MNTELVQPHVDEGQAFWSELELAATPSAIRQTRRFAEMFLHKHGLAALKDTALLIVSELATNAVCASEQTDPHLNGQMPAIGLCLLADGPRLRIEVRDEAVGFPVLWEASVDSERGRGLALIDAMTEGHWGWHSVILPQAAKCVWAEISQQPPATTQAALTPFLHHHTPETGGRNMTTTKTEFTPKAAAADDEARPRELIAPGLFSKLTCRVMAADGYDEGTAERIVEQALAFLVACAHCPGGHLSPSQTVDAGWHAFILHTSDYAEFCQRIAGRFIHHRPNSPAEAASEQQAIGVTITAMRAAGLPVDADLWVPRAVCSQCYQGCADDPKGA